MCIYNKLTQNKKYTANKKNGGIVPPIKDKRTQYVSIGCGKCIECRKKKARDWSVRLQEDIRENKNGKFLTFTFSDKWLNKLEQEIKAKNKKAKGYNLENDAVKLGNKRFLERWRSKYKKSVRHWLVTELGHQGTERIHMHGIIWTDETNETIEKIWKYGKIWVGEYVNEKTINYIVKYISKTDKDHKEYNPIILTSKGIGKGYTERWDGKNSKYKEGKTKDYYKTRQGVKMSLPIYYRNKMYNDEEREKLWIEKLNNEERYVLGTRIDVSTEKGMDIYIKAKETAQIKSKRLGYGDDVKRWEQIQYENEMREIKRITREQKEWAKDKLNNIDIGM